MDGDINEVSEKGVHGVVLLLDFVEVLSVLVNSVAAENVLEELEAVVVGVGDGGGVVSNANVRVVHFIVTDKHEGGSEDRSFANRGRRGSLLHGAESLVAGVDEFLVGNTSSSNNNDVVSEEVSSSESIETFNAQILDVITISHFGLSKHVISVRVVMGKFPGHVGKVLVV